MDDRVYVEVVACSRCVRHSKLNCSFIQLVPTAYEHDGLFSYEEICSFFCLFICFLLSRVLSGLVFSSRSGFCRSFSLYFNHSVQIFELNSKRKVICTKKYVCIIHRGDLARSRVCMGKFKSSDPPTYSKSMKNEWGGHFSTVEVYPFVKGISGLLSENWDLSEDTLEYCLKLKSRKLSSVGDYTLG